MAAELPVGRIAGAFGIHGELKCDPTDAGRTLFSPGAELRYEIGGTVLIARIIAVRPHKERLIVRIAGVDDADAARALTGATFLAERGAIELREGEYLDADLIGCRLETPEGESLDTVTAVEHYPASDMLVAGGRMIPLVRAFVRRIDIGAKRIVVDLPEGLLD